MMKISNRDVPISIVKYYLPDVLKEEVRFIKKHLELKTDSEMYSAMIRFCYSLFKQHAAYQKSETVFTDE